MGNPLAGPAAAPTPDLHWHAILSGRLRIVDWYDRDDRRCVVARPVPPAVRIRLTERQRRALAMRSAGCALKVIAYDLGIAISTASRDIAHAMETLGIESTAALAALLGQSASETLSDGATMAPPNGLTVDSSLDPLHGDVTLSFPLGSRRPVDARLTRIEWCVLSDMARGLSNLEMARQRGVALRTVANQVACLFAKLGVHSRLDAVRAAGHWLTVRTP